MGPPCKYSAQRFDCFEVVEWILKGWRFGASEHWRCSGVHLVVVNIYLFFILECMFDARACGLFLNVERFILVF